MNYKEFLQQVRAAVERISPASTTVKVDEVLKNNRSREACMTILAEGENMSPAIYMNQYYEENQRGTTVEEIAEQIWEYYRTHHKNYQVDFSFYLDFEKVKDRIACKLINYEKNEFLLGKSPHRKFLDLAVVYYCKVEEESFGKGSILIQNQHLDMWRVTSEQLHEIALSNTLRLLPYELVDIADILEEMLGVEIHCAELDAFPMYVLTNQEKNFGAANLLFASVLEGIASTVGGDYFVLPSSIHECMVVPASEEMEPEELRRMVREINQEHVAWEEVLGDSVYRYGKEKGRLEIVC